jgi:hypothetical protein
MPHLLAVWGDSRFLADQDAVRIHELEPCLANPPVGIAEQLQRVRVVPALVVGGKERADVAEPGRSEHGVCEGVRDYIAVRVAGEAAREVDRDAAENEAEALLERVRIDAETDPKFSH